MELAFVCTSKQSISASLRSTSLTLNFVFGNGVGIDEDVVQIL